MCIVAPRLLLVCSSIDRQADARTISCRASWSLKHRALKRVKHILPCKPGLVPAYKGLHISKSDNVSPFPEDQAVLQSCLQNSQLVWENRTEYKMHANEAEEIWDCGLGIL